MWQKIFWWLAERRGTETLTNVYTNQEYMHRVFLVDKFHRTGIAGDYHGGRVCLNLILGSDLPVEHNHGDILHSYCREDTMRLEVRKENGEVQVGLLGEHIMTSIELKYQKVDML